MTKIYYCYITVTLLLHYCYITVTLLLQCLKLNVSLAWQGGQFFMGEKQYIKSISFVIKCKKDKLLTLSPIRLFTGKLDIVTQNTEYGNNGSLPFAAIC